MFFDGLDSVFCGILVFTDDISGSESFNQVLAVFRDPTQVENKLAFDFSLGCKWSVFLDSEGSKDNVTLFITSVSLDKESTVLECSIECDFLALPVVGCVVVECMNEISGDFFV